LFPWPEHHILPAGNKEHFMVEIRRITASDADLFTRIEDEVFDEPVDPARLAAYLSEPGHMLILALHEGLVVGQCAAVLHKHPDKLAELYVDEVGVGRKHLRQGIATRMVEEMFAWGRELGCEEAWLGTELDNDAANALYRSLKGDADQMMYYEFKL
jgi:ribosomal protein S18 acetylase RimI-like enzyme